MFKPFKEFLLERVDDGVIFTFGRFQPMTIGHEAIGKQLKKYAKTLNMKPQIYTSLTQDSKKNPLSFDEKVKVLKAVFPDIYVSDDKSIKTPFDVLQKLSDDGYKRVRMFVGADRVKTFKTQMQKYIPDKYHFDDFDVLSIERVFGISGTKMREFVQKDDFKSFKSYLPKKINDKLAKELFDSIKSTTK
jgi:phosphopantetheine adenylyltransferase